MKTYDVNVKEFIPLISPHVLKDDMPITPEAAQTVISGRRVIQDIIGKKDRRLLVIAGPCSIHDVAAALEYADRLNRLREKVNQTIYLVMRVYFEKPRTNVGWKGLINDPGLDGSCDMMQGLLKARAMLLKILKWVLPPLPKCSIRSPLAYRRIGLLGSHRSPHDRIADPSENGQRFIHAGGV